MSLYLKVAAISALLIFSVFGQQGGNYKSPGPKSGKGTVRAYNKSPCMQEEVQECQASGGTYNWSQCMCRYF